MIIEVVGGIGIAKSEVAAFDRALRMAGVHNYNLLPLSSVIPPSVQVIPREKYREPQRAGEILPVVIARVTSSNPEDWISAGLGWALAKEGGVFLEAGGPQRKDVTKEMIYQGLQEMVETREWDWLKEVHNKVLEARVRDTTCIVVIALYGYVKNVLVGKA